jgi:hypothetical protein
MRLSDVLPYTVVMLLRLIERPGGMTSGSDGRRRLATAAPPFSTIVSSADRASARPRNLSSDEEGRAPRGRANQGHREGAATLAPRSNRSPLSAALPTLRTKCGDRAFRISLEIGHDRIYEPYGFGEVAVVRAESA